MQPAPALRGVRTGIWGSTIQTSSQKRNDAGLHLVDLYDDEDELARRIARFLHAGMSAGEATIAICTPERRARVEAILADGSPNGVAEPPHAGCVWLDAAATLDAFMSCGRIDRDTARATLIPILGAAGAGHAGTRVYGEMVALAWEAGYLSAALELEALWNELKREYSFSLFCAYSGASVAGAEQADELARIHEVHSHVSPDLVTLDVSGAGPTVAAEFPASPLAPRMARELVRAALSRTCQTEVSDIADLLVSELATNAVVHVVSPFSVTATIDRGLLRLEVRDAGSVTSVTRERLLPEPAHGLGIVDALASDWGWEPTATGKVVWAELELEAEE